MAFDTEPKLISNSTRAAGAIDRKRALSATISREMSVMLQVFGFSNKTRRMREDRPEKTLIVLCPLDTGIAISRLFMPMRCSVNLPGRLMKIFPARSIKSIAFCMQNACAWDDNRSEERRVGKECW